MAAHWPVGLVLLGLCLGCGWAWEDVDLGGRAWEVFETAGEVLSSVRLGEMKSIDTGIPQISSHSRAIGYGRRLLQEAKSYCTWKDGVCSLAAEGATELLKDSTSRMSEYIRALFRCEELSSSEECTSDDWCIWNEGNCDANARYVETGSVSKCLGKAGIFLNYSVLKKKCASEYEDSSSCNDQEDCIWDVRKESCRFDLWKGLFGIQSANGGPKGLPQVQRAQGLAWTTEFASNPKLLIAPNPATILAWKPTRIECPEGIEEVVCDYAAPLSQIFVTALYCQRQHVKEGDGCEEDPLCEIRGSQCTVSKEVKNSVLEKQLQALVTNADVDPIVGDLLLPFISCPAKAQHSCWGVCSWNESEDICDVHVLWILQRLSIATSKSPAPECKILTSIYAAGCIGAGDKVCSVNSKCEWDAAGGECNLLGPELHSIITSAEPGVRTAMSENETCKHHKSISTCLG